MKLTISISLRKTVLVLSIAAPFITIASIVGQFFKYSLGHGTVYGFVRLFNLDGEGNIAAWYSALTLMLCSALLAIISSSKKSAGDPYALHWKVMSLIFLYMSIDEATQIHELLIGPLRRTLGAGGVFFYAWVIPGIVLVLIFALAYLRFLLALPAKYRHLFIVSGAIFVAGAIGTEMIGGRYDEIHGRENMTAQMITTAEEFLK